MTRRPGAAGGGGETPEPRRCLACGYDLAGLDACPECGGVSDAADWAARAARAGLLADRGRTIRLAVLGRAAVLGLYPAGAAGLVVFDAIRWDKGWGPALVGGAELWLVAVVALAIAVTAPDALASVLFRWRSRDGVLLETLWLRVGPLLHVPWLLAAPGACNFLALWLLDRAATGGAGVMIGWMWSMFVLAAVAVALPLVFLFVWCRQAYTLRAHQPPGVVLGVLILAGATTLGAVALAAAAVTLLLGVFSGPVFPD